MLYRTWGRVIAINTSASWNCSCCSSYTKRARGDMDCFIENFNFNFNLKMKGSGVCQWITALAQLQVQRRQQTRINSVEETGREIMHCGPQYSSSTINPALHHEMEGWVNMMCLSLILNSLLYSAWTLHCEWTQGNTISALNTCFNRWLPDACKNAVCIIPWTMSIMLQHLIYPELQSLMYRVCTTDISLLNVVSL